jgi:type I restriction enzyme S subunit
LLEPLKYGANEAADSDDSGDPRFVRITDIADDGGLKPDTFRSLPMSIARPYLLDEGDLLLARSGATVGKSFMYSHPWGPCCFAGYLIRARPDPGKVLPQYLRYFSESRLYWQHIASEQIQATIQNVSAERYGNLPVPMPEVDEQRAIVDFLDCETTKIDALIGKQEELIATLREDRTAIITHAVTKGLDPDVALKESGVEGLELIPATWSVTPFLRCVLGRVDYRGATPTKVDDGVLLITARNVRPGWIDYEVSEEFVSAEGYEEVMRRGLPEIDDLLFTMEAPLGNAALVDRTDIALAQRIIKLRPDRRRVLPRFLLYSVLGRWFQSQLIARATGSTALGLKASKLPELRVVVPDIDEQRQIVLLLDQRLGQIDELVTKVTAVVQTLREYRSALVTDAVTGKIDVRGAA